MITEQEIDWFMDHCIFPNKPYKPSYNELIQTYPTALHLVKRNIKQEIKFLKDKTNNLLAHGAVADEGNRAFIHALEEEHQDELARLKLQLKLLEPRDETSCFITPQDIALAKLVPISNFIKIPASKKSICLFHADNQPSLHIYGTTYHCFTCSAHGSTIDIVMKLRNLSFTNAVKFLINK